MTKILVCNPQNYDIRYEINPWMKTTRPAIHALAVEQWNSLILLLQQCGAEIFEMPVDFRSRDLPDMVFTANAGLDYQPQLRYTKRGPLQLANRLFRGRSIDLLEEVLCLKKNRSAFGASDPTKRQVRSTSIYSILIWPLSEVRGSLLTKPLLN